MNRRSLSAEALNSSPSSSSKPQPTSTKKTSDRWTIVCMIIGLTNVLNALWMLIAPAHWFYNLPFNVPAFGPLNYHFIRDLGAIFLLTGVGLLHAGYYPIYRVPLFTVNTAFYVLHMCVHIFEVVSGRVELSMFWTDLPGVYVPAIICSILNIILIRQNQNKRTL